jgi:hypothetical protein
MAYFFKELANKLHLHLIESDLFKANMLPQNREFSKIILGWQCGYYNEECHSPIRNDVTVGVDKSKTLASLKGLVEWVERYSFQEGKNNGNPYCQTKRSEGFAARPFLFLKTCAKNTARETALLEAIERYAWVNWWKNKNTLHYISKIELSDYFSDINEIEVSDFYEIEVPTTIGASLFIYLLKIKNEGYLTGGAAEFNRDSDSAKKRAVSELLRHLLAYQRSKSDNNFSEREYMNRIVSFGSGSRNYEVEERVFKHGDIMTNLPALEIDSEIDQQLSKHVVVYRCRFFNQPEFIDEEITLCF